MRRPCSSPEPATRTHQFVDVQRPLTTSGGPGARCDDPERGSSSARRPSSARSRNPRSARRRRTTSAGVRSMAMAASSTASPGMPATTAPGSARHPTWPAGPSVDSSRPSVHAAAYANGANPSGSRDSARARKTSAAYRSSTVARVTRTTRRTVTVSRSASGSSSNAAISSSEGPRSYQGRVGCHGSCRRRVPRFPDRHRLLDTPETLPALPAGTGCPDAASRRATDGRLPSRPVARPDAWSSSRSAADACIGRQSSTHVHAEGARTPVTPAGRSRSGRRWLSSRCRRAGVRPVGCRRGTGGGRYRGPADGSGVRTGR